MELSVLRLKWSSYRPTDKTDPAREETKPNYCIFTLTLFIIQLSKRAGIDIEVRQNTRPVTNGDSPAPL